MEKFELLGLKIEKNKLMIKIEKDKRLREFLGNLLLKCGFRDNHYLTDDVNYRTDVSKNQDNLENYENKNFDIDIIYAHKAIIISVRVKNEKQKDLFLTYIYEFCEWPTKRKQVRKK